MRRSQRLEPILDLARQREQEAAQALAEAQRVLSDRESRLAELEHYRDEYAAHFDEIMRAGVTAAKAQEYRRFITRLDEAVSQQTQLIEAARQDYEDRRQQWLGVRTKADAMDKAVERFRSHERAVDERREQHESDEHAQRRGQLTPVPGEGDEWGSS